MAVKEVAFFDFDGTLTKKDSLPQFLLHVSGGKKVFFAYCFAFLLASVKKLFNPRIDWRTEIKKRWVFICLCQQPMFDIQKKIIDFCSEIQWRDNILDKLKDHQSKGHDIVIISGALDIYLNEILKPFHINKVYSTEMEIRDGFLTGYWKQANCVREEKAVIVKNYMEKHGPFKTSYAYGNSHCDRFMIEAVDQGQRV